MLRDKNDRAVVVKKKVGRPRALVRTRINDNQELKRGLGISVVTTPVVAANKWLCGGAKLSVASVSGDQEAEKE